MTIIALYQNHDEVDLFSRIVPNDVIRANNADLSPSKYVTKHVAETLISVDEAMSALRTAAEAVKQSEQRVLQMLKNWKLL